MIPPASAIVTPQSLHARKARVQETGPVLPRAVRGLQVHIWDLCPRCPRQALQPPSAPEPHVWQLLPPLCHPQMLRRRGSTQQPGRPEYDSVWGDNLAVSWQN